jgi:AcrR family transcriptional regulator
MVSSSTTSARVLDAALALIAQRGEANVTMAHIAKAARLSRQAVYLHFADRSALMLAAARHLDERLGLPEEIRRIEEAPTGVAMIAAMVSLQARRNHALWPLARAVDAVRRTDPAAERTWQDRLENRLRGCRAIVARLRRERTLKTGLGPAVAADLLWSLTSLRMWEDLVLQCAWSAEQYVTYVTALCLEALTTRRSDRYSAFPRTASGRV